MLLSKTEIEKIDIEAISTNDVITIIEKTLEVDLSVLGEEKLEDFVIMSKALANMLNEAKEIKEGTQSLIEAQEMICERIEGKEV